LSWAAPLYRGALARGWKWESAAKPAVQGVRKMLGMGGGVAIKSSLERPGLQKADKLARSPTNWEKIGDDEGIGLKRE